MFRNKNKIALLGAFIVTLLVNFPRLMIVLVGSNRGSEIGITFSDFLLRSCFLYLFSWLVLTINLKWIETVKKKNVLLIEIGVNLILLIFGVILFTMVKQLLLPGPYLNRQVIFISFSIYLIVVVLLVVIARLVKLNESHQYQLIQNEVVKQKALEHQLEALRSQINPHFLFNTLNSLKALIQQNSVKSADYVDKLSWLLRSTLEGKESDFITIRKELDYLEAYMYLQKERFGDKLSLHIAIPKELYLDKIPSFALQLLVENAIKHNIVSNRKPLEICIHFEEGNIVVKNPIQTRSDNLDSTGVGLPNLSTRFTLLKGKSIVIEKKDNSFIVKLPL